MKPSKLIRRSATFYDHLKQALELINTPSALGSQSPLATPYVLGDALQGFEASATGRGLALAALIQRATEHLWGGPLPQDGQAFFNTAIGESVPGGRYGCLVLELNYFKQRYHPIPKNQVEIYTDILHISRPTHDRHLRSAIEHLATVVLQQLRPALHLEQPISPPTLIGREVVLSQIAQDIQAGKTISLTGDSGVGKTALAAALAQRWHGSNRFWYTFRHALNDQIESILFALGHFLHQRGASSLWHQLIVDRGRVAGGLALGLVLADFAQLSERPLLCFDELDVLYALDQTQAHPNQQQIIAFLDGIRGHVPMLLLGQSGFWASDATYQLTELTNDQLATWLTNLDIPHTAADVSHIYRYTAGNPRLIELCVALYHAHPGASFAAVVEQLPTAQTLLPIWLRLEARLSLAERYLLQALSVFRSPMPADAWAGSAEHSAALEHMSARRLVQHTERGAITLLPALREVIYTALPVETREELHGQAAHIRAERAEYTAAAYHLHMADEPEAAIDLWYAQREHEISQGQAGAALAIFSQISQRRLSVRHRRDLVLLRAELHELAGSPAAVVEELAQVEWPADESRTPTALLRLGQAFESQGQPTQALQTYQSGLDALVTLLQQGTQLHVQRSLSHLRQREMQPAWREANLAHFHAQIMLGVVRDQSGDYESAQQHYLSALGIAQLAEYPAGLAQSYHYLAMLAGRRQNLAEALPAFEQAITFYQQIGDRVNQEIVRSNLASAYIQVRQFAAALEPAEQAFRFFAAMGNSVRTAQNASNLAEAHAELGNLDQAQHYARLVLEQNEPQSHPYALYTLGTVYRLRGDWQQSERYYDQSRRIAEVNDDSYLQAFAWRALGEVGRGQSQHAAAEHAFAQARMLFEQLHITEEVRETDRIAAQHDA